MSGYGSLGPGTGGAVRASDMSAVAVVRAVVPVVQCSRSAARPHGRRDVSRSCSESTSEPQQRGINVESVDPKAVTCVTDT